MAGLKEVSQSLMHSSRTATDSVYSVPSTENVGERIAGLSCDKGSQVGIDARIVAQIVLKTMRTIKE